MGNNIQQNVLEAIELVAANKVASFGFDTTEIATVISKLDNGNYWVSNGKIKYEAKPTDDTPYAENSQIYVTVTNGDYNLDKIIAGRYENKTGEEKVYLHKDPYERLLVYKTWDATSSEDYPTFNNSNPLGHPTLLGVEVFCKVVETEEKNPYSLKISFKKEEKDLAFFIINSEDFMGNPYNMDLAIGHKFLFAIPSGLNLLDDSIHCDFEVSENILSWSAILNFGYDLESSAVKQALGQVYIDTSNGIKTYSNEKEEEKEKYKDGYVGKVDNNIKLQNGTIINDFETLFFDLGLTKQNNSVYGYSNSGSLCTSLAENKKYKIEFKSFIKPGFNSAKVIIGDKTFDIVASGLWNKHTIEIETTGDASDLKLQINKDEDSDAIVYLKDFIVYELNTTESLDTINLSWIKNTRIYDKDNQLSSATVKWYRYVPNTKDQDLGVGWQQIEKDGDNDDWSLNLKVSDKDTGVRLYLNPEVAEERFKAAIILGTETYVSNTLVLKNRDYVDEGKAVSSETMTLKLSDDGIYLYDNVGQLFENDKNTKTITATSNQQREEDYAEVYWLIPKNSTMIAEPQYMTTEDNKYYWNYAPHILFDEQPSLEDFTFDVSNLNSNNFSHPELLQDVNNYYIVGGRNDTPWLDFSFNIKTQYQPNYLNNTILCKAYLKPEAAVTTEWGSIDLKFVSANNSGIEASLGIELEGTKDYFINTDGKNDKITLHAFVYNKDGYRFSSQPSTITWYSFNGNKFIETETETSTVEEGDETTTEGNKDEITKENTSIGSGATLTITNNGASAQIIKAVCEWNSETTGQLVQLTAYYIIPYYTKADEVYQLEGPTRFVYDSFGRNPSPSDGEYKILNSAGRSFTVESNSNDIIVKELAAADKDSDFSFYIQAPLLAPAEEKFYYLNFYNGGLVFQYPLLLLRNTYGFKEINKWKDEETLIETEYILSPMIGAGSKNDANQFTGVMMGTHSEFPKTGSQIESQTGLYGFQNGVATFGFKADGSAFLGADETTGRIEFNTDEDNNSSLKIRTNKFDLCAENEDGIAILRNNVKDDSEEENPNYSDNDYNLFKVGTAENYIRFSPYDGFKLSGTVIGWEDIYNKPTILEDGKITVDDIDGLESIIPNLDNVTETWYQSDDPSVEWYKEDEDGNIIDTREAHKSDLWHCTADNFIKVRTEGLWYPYEEINDVKIFRYLNDGTTIYFQDTTDNVDSPKQNDWCISIKEEKLWLYNKTEWEDKTETADLLYNFLLWLQNKIPTPHIPITVSNYITEPTSPNIGDIWCCRAKDSEWIWYETIKDETKSYEWKRIDIADEIFDKLDGKSQIFIITPTPPYYVGDLWIQLNSSESTDDDIYVCRKSRGKDETYHAEDWTLMDTNSEFEASINQTIENMQQQIDNATIQTWYQGTDPNAEWTNEEDKEAHVGDYWYCTEDIKDENGEIATAKGSKFVFEKNTDGSYSWKSVDNIPDDLFDVIDGKRDIYVLKPEDGYRKGDLWIIGESDCVSDSDENGINDIVLGNPTTVYEPDDVVIAINDSTTFNSEDWVALNSRDGRDALNQLDEIVADGVITPIEKLYLRTMWQGIKSEYDSICDQYANYFKVKVPESLDGIIDSTGYQYKLDLYAQAYNNLKDYAVGPDEKSGILGNMNEKSKVDNSYNIYFSSYYDCKELLLKDMADMSSKIKEIEDDLNQIDGKIETWYQDTDPSEAWTTDTLKVQHEGDIWVYVGPDIKNGKKNGDGFQWEKNDSNEYSWEELDSEYLRNLAYYKPTIFTTVSAAITGQGYRKNDLLIPMEDIVDGEVTKFKKGQIYVATGNFWDGNCIYKTFIPLEYMTDAEIEDFLTNNSDVIKNLQTAIDSKIQTWYQSTDPSNEWYKEDGSIPDVREFHIGDYWYCTNDIKDENNLVIYQKGEYVYTEGYTWETANIPDSLYDLADGKSTVYTKITGDDVPEDGDLLIPSFDGAGSSAENKGNTMDQGENLVQADKVYRYKDGAWYPIDYTDVNYVNTQISTGLDKWLDENKDEIVGNLQDSIDELIQTWYQAEVPSEKWSGKDTDGKDIPDTREKHIGDYWRYTGTDSLSPSREDIDQEEILPGDEFVYTYKDNEYKWEKLEVPDEIFDLLDGKNKIYYEEQPDSANKGDLSIQTTTGEDRKEYQEFYIYTGSQWIPLDPYSKLIATVNEVQDEVDKKTETWYQVTDPSEAWDDKNKHIGDLWFNPNENKNYIYNSSYEWAEADGVPNSVFDAIDGKRQVFVDTPEPPYKIGDLWVDLTNKTTKVATKDRDSEETYDSTDWTDIKTQDAQSALNQSQQAIDNLEDFIKDKYNPALASLQASIDGKINTWYTSADPSESWTDNITKKAHVGDLWYYTGTSNKIININTTAKPNSQWIWQEVSTDKYQWEIVNVPQEVFDKIDGVASIYTTIPSNPVIGDLLIPTNNINAEGRLYATGKVYKYDGTTWNEINYTDENYVNNKVDASKASALETVSKFLNGGITTNLSGSDYTISPYIGGGYLNIQSSEQNNMDDIYPIRVIIDPGKKDGDNINKDVILLQKGQKTLNATNKVNITWDYQKIFSVNEYGELHIGNDSHYIKFSPTIKNKTKDANGQYVTENSFLNIVTEQFDFNAVKPNADGTSSGIEFSSDYGLKMYNNSTDPLVEITPKGDFYVGDESKGYIRFDRGDYKGTTYLKIQAYDFDFKAGEINNSSSTREMVNGISFTKNGLKGYSNNSQTFGLSPNGDFFVGVTINGGELYQGIKFSGGEFLIKANIQRTGTYSFDKFYKYKTGTTSFALSNNKNISIGNYINDSIFSGLEFAITPDDASATPRKSYIGNILGYNKAYDVSTQLNSRGVGFIMRNDIDEEMAITSKGTLFLGAANNNSAYYSYEENNWNKNENGYIHISPDTDGSIMHLHAKQIWFKGQPVAENNAYYFTDRAPNTNTFISVDQQNTGGGPYFWLRCGWYRIRFDLQNHKIAFQDYDFTNSKFSTKKTI